MDSTECNGQRYGNDDSTERITQRNSMDDDVHGLAPPLVPHQTHLAHDMDGSAVRPTSRQLNMVGRIAEAGLTYVNSNMVSHWQAPATGWQQSHQPA